MAACGLTRLDGRPKRAIVYECTDTNGRGSFRFRQDAVNAPNAGPDLADTLTTIEGALKKGLRWRGTRVAPA